MHNTRMLCYLCYCYLTYVAMQLQPKSLQGNVCKGLMIKILIRQSVVFKTPVCLYLECRRHKAILHKPVGDVIKDRFNI